MAERPVTRDALGLALGAGRAVASWSASPGSAARLESFSFDAAALADGDASALSALATLCTTKPRLPTLHVALAAPWTSPRLLTLPPMRATDAQRALARDAARWFPHASEPTAVAVAPASGAQWLAADARHAVLDAITHAALQAGFGAVRCVPAIAALGASSSATYLLDGEAATIAGKDGRFTSLRRCRVADLPPSVTVQEDGLMLAATRAPWCTGPEFISGRTAAARDALAWRATRQLLGIAAGAAAIALALHVWAASHRVAALQARRAALRPVVAPMLAQRDSLTDITDAITLIASTAQNTWSHRVQLVATALPSGARLSSIAGDADSLRIEGTAADAAQAIQRLRGAAGVRQVDDRSPSDRVADGAFAAVVRFTPGGPR